MESREILILPITERTSGTEIGASRAESVVDEQPLDVPLVALDLKWKFLD